LIDTLAVHEPLLVNTIGHSAGALIFAIFLFLLLQDRAGKRLRGSRLSITAAALAFFWNLGSLLVLATAASASWWHVAVVAFSTAVLSLLPAVLLHLCLEDRLRPIVVAGYALSAVAILIHFGEAALARPNLHRTALAVTTIGFGVLTVISAVSVVMSRESARGRLTSRIIGSMSLFLFAMSFVHLGGEPHAAWAMELLLHHAGIPLAIFVLLQDYRFVLLDAFIRFLANILLAAGFAFATLEAAAKLGLRLPSLQNPVYEGLLLVGGCLMLIVFAMVRNWLQQILTSIVFERRDLEGTLHEFRSKGPAAASEAEYLNWAEARMAKFMNAERIEMDESWKEALGRCGLVFPAPVGDLAEHGDDRPGGPVEAVVPLRLSHGETRYVLLGRRRGGRRYLSEDLGALARLGAQVVEQVEQFRESEMRRLASQAEFRALQSQIHPHFLFNALNTLYGVIPKQAEGARRTVLNLADIFRYFLRGEKTYIPLEEELRIVRAYLEIEGLRLGGKLKTEIHVDDDALPVPIPVLSIQPLVENAVKHGVAPKAEGGTVYLDATRLAGGLRVSVRDSGCGFQPAGPERGKGLGMALENVSRRLKLCYGPEAKLEIESGPDGSSVGFLVPCQSSVVSHQSSVNGDQ
jgi:hypothetical protein